LLSINLKINFAQLNQKLAKKLANLSFGQFKIKPLRLNLRFYQEILVFVNNITKFWFEFIWFRGYCVTAILSIKKLKKYFG